MVSFWVVITSVFITIVIAPLVIALPEAGSKPMNMSLSGKCANHFAGDSVWPDLAKFRHFGKSLQVFGKFLLVYFFFGKMVSILWQICDIIRLNFVVANSQIFKNNLTIWSHWRRWKKDENSRQLSSLWSFKQVRINLHSEELIKTFIKRKVSVWCSYLPALPMISVTRKNHQSL